jgi:hypothetical protein
VRALEDLVCVFEDLLQRETPATCDLPLSAGEFAENLAFSLITLVGLQAQEDRLCATARRKNNGVLGAADTTNDARRILSKLGDGHGA